MKMPDYIEYELLWENMSMKTKTDSLREALAEVIKEINKLKGDK